VKRKRKLLLLFAVFLFVLWGCGKKQEKENSYKLYYVNQAGTRLAESDYYPQAQTFEEMMDELLRQLQNPPAGSSGLMSVFAEGVAVNGYERGIDALRIDFSGEYYKLSNTQEVLLRAAVVKTFSQVPGVAKVMITVNKEQLKDTAGELVQPMDANSFIDTKEGGINSYQYATLILYFADSDGEKLVKETRSLHYSSNMVQERVVVEQLLAGPEESGHKAVLGSDVRIQNVYIQNGICTINFDESVNNMPSENPPDATVVLYAVVNSICDTCDGISGVKFEINGDSDVLFWNTVDLNQVFMMNRSYIEQSSMQTEETAA